MYARTGVGGRRLLGLEVRAYWGWMYALTGVGGTRLMGLEVRAYWGWTLPLTGVGGKALIGVGGRRLPACRRATRAAPAQQSAMVSTLVSMWSEQISTWSEQISTSTAPPLTRAAPEQQSAISNQPAPRVRVSNSVLWSRAVTPVRTRPIPVKLLCAAFGTGCGWDPRHQRRWDLIAMPLVTKGAGDETHLESRTQTMLAAITRIWNW